LWQLTFPYMFTREVISFNDQHFQCRLIFEQHGSERRTAWSATDDYDIEMICHIVCLELV